MIARNRRGAVRPGDGDACAAYIEKTGICEYRETPGNISVTNTSGTTRCRRPNRTWGVTDPLR